MKKRKYRFVEDFPEPATGQPREITESPKVITTKNFGKRTLHRIAFCKYTEKEVDGKKTIVESMGAKGGWIERYDNLSQSGECWVHPNGIVVGNAAVVGDSQIKGGEVGEGAKISGKATIRDRVCIRGNTAVYRDAVVMDDVVVKGNAKVSGMIMGKSVIKGDARLFGDSATKEVSNDIGRILAESDSMKLLVIDSVIDGRANIISTISSTVIVDSEIHDKTEIHGGTIYNKVKLVGNTYVNGDVIGPIVIRDGCLTGSAGLISSILKDYSWYNDWGLNSDDIFAFLNLPKSLQYKGAP